MVSLADLRRPLVVTFGEIMLRLKSPGHERLFQSPALEATFAGGEANVAVSVANYGLRSRYVTALPEGPLGDAVVGELRRFAVETDHIVRRPGRLGIYFIEAGAAQRASTVIYDRDGAAIAVADPSEFDWAAIFDGADWFHVSGITPALSETAAACTAASLRAAKRGGCHDLARPQLPRQAVALRQGRARGHARPHGRRRHRHRQRGGRAAVPGHRGRCRRDLRTARSRRPTKR